VDGRVKPGHDDEEASAMNSLIVIARSVSDEAIHVVLAALDCFASLAMTTLLHQALVEDDI
jgi:hypothetical protein